MLKYFANKIMTTLFVLTFCSAVLQTPVEHAVEQSTAVAGPQSEIILQERTAHTRFIG